MLVNIDKSYFLLNNLINIVSNDIKVLFPYKMEPIEVGFKYLGYRVKPLNYLDKDWKWLVKKFEKRVYNWTYRFLSLEGRLILLKFVLSGIPVYWFSLIKILCSIMKDIKNIICNLLWGGM